MGESYKYELQLEDCARFIVKKNLKKVVLQLKKDDLKYSVPIINFIKFRVYFLRFNTLTDPDRPTSCIDLYVTRSNTCCLDLLITQHIADVDGVIHFGNLCLSKPQVIESQQGIPILCVFGRKKYENQDKFYRNLFKIRDRIESLISNQKKYCLLYDSSLMDYVLALDKRTDFLKYGDLHIADLVILNQNWETTSKHAHYFVSSKSKLDYRKDICYGHFGLPRPVEDYDCIIYFGSCPHLNLTLSGPQKFLRVDCYDEVEFEEINVQRLLGRRIAMLDNIKEYEDLKIGVIITNPLPDVRAAMERLELLAKHRKHTLYFISMIQTIDECKIGNFDLCDAFIVINSCVCSTILETLHFNRPIITETEFQLACGIETKYGGVLWPGLKPNVSNLSNCDDLINKRKISDVSVALIQTRNELLERCNQASANRWSGLEYNITNGGEESLDIEEGLKGIASSYSSEPLSKDN